MEQNHDPLALAKSRKRPRSIGSTASIHSASTQPNLDQVFADTTPDVYQGQWIAHNHNQHSHHHHSPPQRIIAPAPPQMTTEDLLLASQVQANREYMATHVANNVTHAVGFSTMQEASFHHHSHGMSRPSLEAESFAGHSSFGGNDSQTLDRDGADDGDLLACMGGNGKQQSRSSANNETEMRQLFVANKHRGLVDVAEELHGNERGPNSERTRQIFAMLWINSVCSKGKGSVPRGRVYANYASRCATERITVLNPASFGKLVRVLFPGLKTRRLGVRGESKYHYVNFNLAEEQVDARDDLSSSQAQLALGEGVTFAESFNTVLNTRPERSALAPTGIENATTVGPSATRLAEYRHSLYNQPSVPSIDQLQTSNIKTAQTLHLAADADFWQQSDPLLMPPIDPFLPSRTDADAAKSLSALYLSHCTSLIECIRYCKEKTFFHLFTSFQGTLTMPVQRLFGNPALAPWIEECDFVLYQRMMRIVSNLVLQVVPKPVLDTLRNISARLVPHIRDSFQGQPSHVVCAKEAPATIFAGLLDRALRVNLTAHAAANMLSNPANRDLMYTEWISMVNVRKVAECVPTRGMDDLVIVLLREMRHLLDPVNILWDVECLTLQGEIAMHSGQPKPSNAGDSSASNVLDRWLVFLRTLPERFPYASHTDIVWSVQRVGTSVMRDLTISQGKSFGSWWVTKCWIDEMIQFEAEKGGFLQSKATMQRALVRVVPSMNPIACRNQSNPNSRYSSGSDDFNMSHVSQLQPDRAQFSPASHSHQRQQASHDDSGIGIRTPDEESPMDKFAFNTPNNRQDFFAGTEIQDV